MKKLALVLLLLLTASLAGQTVRPTRISQLRLTQLTTAQESGMTLVEGDVWENITIGCIRYRLASSTVCIATVPSSAVLLNPTGAQAILDFNLSTPILNGIHVVDDVKFTTVQLAHDNLPATGGIIFVPEGNRSEASLTISKDNVKIVFDRTTYTLTQTAACPLTITGDDAHLISTGKRGALILGSATTGNVLCLSGNRAQIENLRVTGSASSVDLVSITDGVFNKIEDVDLVNSGPGSGDCIDISGASTFFTTLDDVDCEVASGGGDGFRVASGANGGKIFGGRIRNAVNGLNLGADTWYVWGTDIENSTDCVKVTGDFNQIYARTESCSSDGIFTDTGADGNIISGTYPDGLNITEVSNALLAVYDGSLPLEIKLGARNLAQLGTPADGTIVYCTDCLRGSNPCTASSSGAFAMRENSAWNCGELLPANPLEGTLTNVPRWILKIVDHTDMTTAGTADDFVLWTLPANTMIHDVVGTVVTAWEAVVGLSAAVCSVGTAAGSANDLTLDDDFFAIATVYELHDATASGGKGAKLFDSTDKFAPFMLVASGDIEIQCDLTGDDHADTNAGQARIYILVSQPLGNTTTEAN